MQAGAACVLAARDLDVPTVVVDDPAGALGLLARSVLDRLDVTVEIVEEFYAIDLALPPLEKTQN